MKKFTFKLESLLRLRRNQRDLCHQLLAEVMRREEELLAARQHVETDRRMQLAEMQELTSEGDVNVEGVTTRRYYAGQLIGDIGSIERQRQIVAQQLVLCRRRLMQADQAVKMLEKLSDKQLSEFQSEQERRDARELDECWRGAAAGVGT